MLEVYYLIKGIIIGFIVAIPVGPVAALCIGRTLNKGWLKGIFTAIGATLGDGFWACIAAFGLTFILDLLIKYDFWLRLLGGCFLIIMGMYILFKKKEIKSWFKSDDAAENWGKTISSTFFSSIANPITLFAYIALFSGFGLANAKDGFLPAGSLVVGVLIGSATWWLILVQSFTLFRNHLGDKTLTILNKITGGFVVFFGIIILLTLIFHVKLIGETF